MTQHIPDGLLQQLLLLYLYRVRTATRSQINRSFPRFNTRQVTNALQRVRHNGFARPAQLRRGTAWALTEAGHAAAMATNRVRERRYVDVATLANAAHLYGINESCTAVGTWAGHYGDEFVWEVEVAHPYGKNRAVIADAVLTYTLWRPRDNTALTLIRFIEYDRGTETVNRLVDKLKAYLSLRTWRIDKKRDRRAKRPEYAWQDYYSVWPSILIVFGDMDEDAAERRAATLRLNASADPYLRENARLVPATTTTLAKLQTFDPFRSPILTSVAEGDDIVLAERD